MNKNRNNKYKKHHNNNNNNNNNNEENEGLLQVIVMDQEDDDETDYSIVPNTPKVGDRYRSEIESSAAEGDTIQLIPVSLDREPRRRRHFNRRMGRRHRSRSQQRYKTDQEEVVKPSLPFPPIIEEEHETNEHDHLHIHVHSEPEHDHEHGIGNEHERIPSPTSVHGEEREKEITCLAARTALIIPFGFSTYAHPPSYWVQYLTERTVLSNSGEDIPLWEQSEILPLEVAELSRQFRQMVGWQDRKGRHSGNAWGCRRLKLSKRAKKELFSHPKLWAIHREGNDEREMYREVELEGIELLLFPLGIGILVFNIDWMTPSVTEQSESNHEEAASGTEEEYPDTHSWSYTEKHTPSENAKPPLLLLNDLRTWLYVARFRHTVPHIVKGWTFESKSPSPTVAHFDSLGKRLSRAIYEGKPVSLNAIGNWLLMSKDESASHPHTRVSYGGYAYHHTTVVTNSELDKNTLHEYLFHLRRGYGQKNRPPPTQFYEIPDEVLAADSRGAGPHGSFDKVLVPRLNRYIGISREGIVCLTWSTEVSGTSFDVARWHKKFQGIYLVLSLHAHGERAVLEELSTVAATRADNMKLEPDKASIQEMEASRRQMKELATMVARFTISMSSDDCGGQSEYSEFFTTVRKVFGIPRQRAELREELQDTLALLDSGYLEERRRIKMEEAKEERAERDRLRRMRLAKEAEKHRYEVIVSSISSVTIPPVLLASLFGMNVDVPIISFWALVGIMLAVSVVVLVVQLVYLRGLDRKHRNDGE